MLNNGTHKTSIKIRFLAYLLIVFVFVFIVLMAFFDFPKLIKQNENNKIYNSDNNQNTILKMDVEGLQTEESLSMSGSGNFTSVLIVGIDARSSEVRNGEIVNLKPEGQAGTRNADIIMQVIFDHRDNKVFMVSIPRDMGVNVREKCLTYSGSIHWVYDKGQNAKCPGGGVETLKKVVASITGIQVNYHAFIALDSFLDVVQTVGIKDSKGNVGIVVENPRGFSDLYPADDQKGWESVYFPKGQLFLTPYRALQYARTRQYTGDFDRASRQQLVVESLAKNVLNSSTLMDPVKISSLMSTYKNKTLISEPNSLGEILKLIDIARSADLTNITKLILGPELGGHEKYLDKQPHGRPGGPYYMVPTAWRECPGNEFCKVQEYIAQIMIDPNLYINSGE